MTTLILLPSHQPCLHFSSLLLPFYLLTGGPRAGRGGADHNKAIHGHPAPHQSTERGRGLEVWKMERMGGAVSTQKESKDAKTRERDGGWTSQKAEVGAWWGKTGWVNSATRKNTNLDRQRLRGRQASTLPFIRSLDSRRLHTHTNIQLKTCWRLVTLGGKYIKIED